MTRSADEPAPGGPVAPEAALPRVRALPELAVLPDLSWVLSAECRYTARLTGCGAVWLARRSGGQKVPGSSPASPTTSPLNLRFPDVGQRDSHHRGVSGTSFEYLDVSCIVLPAVMLTGVLQYVIAFRACRPCKVAVGRYTSVPFLPQDEVDTGLGGGEPPVYTRCAVARRGVGDAPGVDALGAAAAGDVVRRVTPAVVDVVEVGRESPPCGEGGSRDVVDLILDVDGVGFRSTCS